MKTKRIVSLLTALTVSLLTFSSCSKTQPVISETDNTTKTAQVKYTDTPSAVKKSETVYVNLSPDGKPLTVNVTDRIHTDKEKVAVSDISNLQNISDIKGDSVPEISGNSLTWHMSGTDLYYKGTSAEPLPVEFDIKYYLDGNEITADEIKGKSGNVKIEVKTKNACSKTDENGNTVFLPVITAGLIILPETVFSNVNAENGMCLGDGAKQIFAGISFPGMAESLGLSDTLTLGNMEISDSFSVTATAKDFSLGNIYFAVIPVCSLSADTLIPGTEKEAAALLADMEGIMNVLSGTDLATLSGIFENNPDCIKELTDSFDKAINVYSSNKKLLDVMNKYLTEENAETLSDLSKTLNDPKTAEALELLKNPVIRTFLSDLPSLLESVDEISKLTSQLSEDMKDPEIKKAIDNLPETISALSEIQTTLNENKALIDLLSAFASEDLMSIADTLSGSDTNSVLTYLSENADSLMPRIRSWITFGKDYGLFSGCPENAEKSLIFIFMTPSI